MKALTLNVHSWIEEDPLDKMKQLAKIIKDRDYDIIALQEVNQPVDESALRHPHFIPATGEVNDIPLKRYNYAGLIIDELAQMELDYYWTWCANHKGYGTYDEGLALLSKYPIEAKAFLVSKTTNFKSRYTRKILKAKTEIDGITWTFFNGHFSWWLDPSGNELFKKEWSKARQFIEEDERGHLLFMGDFNNAASVAIEGYDYVLSQDPYLQDSYKIAQEVSGEVTVPGKIAGWESSINGKRIDYIFVGDKVEVVSYKVVFNDRDTPMVSDHFGVEIDFH